MSAIYSRQRVREAVARALLLAPERGEEVAIESAAAALAIPIECVREAIDEPATEEAA